MTTLLGENRTKENMAFVIDELSMAQGFALIAAAREANAWATPVRVTPGYVAQEISRLTEMEARR